VSSYLKHFNFYVDSFLSLYRYRINNNMFYGYMLNSFACIYKYVYRSLGRCWSWLLVYSWNVLFMEHGKVGHSCHGPAVRNVRQHNLKGQSHEIFKYSLLLITWIGQTKFRRQFCQCVSQFALSTSPRNTYLLDTTQLSQYYCGQNLVDIFIRKDTLR
jgi:hypothetical protein